MLAAQGKDEGHCIHTLAPYFSFPKNGADQDVIPAVSHDAYYMVIAPTRGLLFSQDELSFWDRQKGHPKAVTHTLGCPVDILV